MRLFPAVSNNTVAAHVFLTGFLLSALSAWADDVPPPTYAGPGALQSAQSAAAAAASQESVAQLIAALNKSQSQQKQGVATPTPEQNSVLQSLYAAANADKEKEKAAQRELMLGSATDPNSARYKSNQLAKKAAQQRSNEAAWGNMSSGAAEESLGPPPEIEDLQRVNESLGGGLGAAIADDSVGSEISLDLRKEAQKEAALSYGARGGLAKHSYQIMESMDGFDGVLDRVFNFRALLISAPSGLLIEPPIVKASDDALVITEGGTEAAVASEVFDINKQAKIVSAPRDWRQYLMQLWSDVPPPPRILWPKNPQEQANWNSWVAQGWKVGFEQAEQIFEVNTNRLVADFNGMVRYKMLLAQRMISEPYAMHEDRGVTGDKNQMRVGDRALRITGPSQFLMGADLWKPADR
ncbi:MAG: type IV secretory system conjugative DNA transfer family protein [Proteobacteria bacterium]|nr:type IV secretory system conjugative DNA transfer family protein [Pseudomonadota bacterium]